ncbi:hypothetical protein [Robertkochia solimangrovi]|uniref:hypothetical protein n=1 Tax=Robertkochia solimangrovi TaxID=2213046 RepID=UPI00117FC279|nr:hypothetical protein [Robertkochia solimangrovi]TRZ42181.1 hypothetical protein DMZ48_14215 [Robertkochia solimangrovi]
MRQVINIISGFIFGLAPLAGATIIGIAIYASLPNTIGIIILGLLGVLSIWLGLKIFKRVQIVGPIEFMTAVHASPDLDNLEPTKDSETKRRFPEEFVRIVENNDNLFKGGTFRIFGDWFGKPYDNYHEIESAEYDEQLKRLTLNFNEGEKLEIYNPKHIFEASTFLKIINADRIQLTWFYYGKTQTKENQYFLDYNLKDKKVTTETNVDWYKPIFDVSLGEPALMIYG